MKKYTVEIRTPNKMFFVKGIFARTPARWIINENELESIKIKIASEGIENFTIEEYDPTKQVHSKPPVIKEKVKKQPEEIKPIKEPTTTLEKLMVEDKDNE